MIHWNLGGGFLNYELLAKLVNIVHFYKPEGHRLDVFDAPFMSNWEGGRLGAPSMSADDGLSGIIRNYNQHGVGFNFVFSNSLVRQEHLADKRCNWFLEHHHDPLNGVIVSSELLADYIRKAYPKYRLILSLTHGKSRPSDLDFYQRAQEKYDVVVLVPDLNSNLDFIRQLDASRLEILVNETCLRGCQFRPMHYKTIDWFNLHKDFSVERDVHSFCMIHNQEFFGMTHAEVANLKGLKLEYAEVDELIRMGVRHFKFSGRRLSSNYSQFKADISRVLFPAMGISDIAWRIEDSGRFGGNAASAPRSPKRILDLIQKVRQDLAS